MSEEPEAPDFALLRVPLCALGDLAEVERTGSLSGLMADAVDLTSGSRALAGIAAEPTKVMRLAARMTTRCAPYGAFAGTGLVPVGAPSTLRVTGYHARVEVDAAVVERMAVLATSRTLDDSQPLRRNPMLYRSRNHWLAQEGPSLNSRATKVRTSPAIEAVLDLLGDGEATVDEIAGQLAVSTSGSSESIRAFVSKLRRVGILTDHPMIAGVGSSPIDRMAAVWRSQDRDLDMSRSSLTGPIDADLVAGQRAVWESFVGSSPEPPDVRDGEAFHVDLRATVTGSIDEQVARSVRRASMRLREAIRPPARMADLALRFEARFGDVDVPLLEAFDPDRGLDVPRTRVESIDANRSGVRLDHPDASGELEMPRYLVELLPRIIDGDARIDLGPPRSTSDAEAAMTHARLVGSGEPSGDRAVLVGYVGRSPVALMGRFSADRPEIEQALRSRVDEFERRAASHGVLLVDVMARADSRAANIVRRGQISQAVLDIWSHSTGNVPLHDILVGCPNGEFTLRRASSGQVVVPMLHSAHNYMHADCLPVYKFLGALADVDSAAWDWGELTSLRRLPRVVSDDVILAPASWQFSAEQLAAVIESASPAIELTHQIPEFEAHRWLGVEVGENVQVFDRSSDLQILSTLRPLRGERVSIKEVPHVEYPGCVDRQGASVVAEALFPGKVDDWPTHSFPFAAGRAALREAASEAASDWTYWQLYCCSTVMDDVIVDLHAAMCSAESSPGEVTDWFFVRYGDPDDHLRVRLRTDSTAMTTAVTEVIRRCLDDGTFHRVVTDTYLPEIRRYGGPDLMEMAHRTFTWSSDRAARHVNDSRDPSLRILSAVEDCMLLTQCLHDDPLAAASYLVQHRMGLPHQMDTTTKGFQRIMRSLKSDLTTLSRQAPPPLPPELEAMRSTLAPLHRDEASHILSSLIHMHVNRALSAEPWRAEPIVIEFAARALRTRSHLAGKRKEPGDG